MHSLRFAVRCTARRRFVTNSRTIGIRVQSFSSNHTTATSDSLEEARIQIIQSSLAQVHQHGWTEDAILEAVTSNKLSLTLIGMASPSDLITYFMDDCQQQFQSELDKTYLPIWKEQENANVSERLVTCIKTRLQMVLPYIKSNQWHQGMAMGATSTPSTTAAQLDALVQSISDAIVVGSTNSHHPPLGVVERVAIGALYVSTELHLLADDSPSYQATWDFLESRVQELQVMAQATDINGWLSSDTAVAASAVATSLGGAVVSLLQPAARGAVSTVASTIIPHLATFLQSPSSSSSSSRQDGTRASDYDVVNTTKQDEATTTTPKIVSTATR